MTSTMINETKIVKTDDNLLEREQEADFSDSLRSKSLRPASEAQRQSVGLEIESYALQTAVQAVVSSSGRFAGSQSQAVGR